MTGIRVIVYQIWIKGATRGTKAVGFVDTDIPTTALTSSKSRWKDHVRSKVRKQMSGNIQSVNVLAQPKDGAHVVVTLGADKRIFPKPKRPVTRGGQPIVPPQKHRTMARVGRSR